MEPQAPKQRYKFLHSLLMLLGHLAGTAFIFVAFFTLSWGVGAFLEIVHGVHNFPPQIYAFITKAEQFLIYADAAFCAVVLVAGMLRFLRDFFK